MSGLRRVQALFDRSVELPPDEREAFLAREAAGDEALRRTVRELLAADARPLPDLDRRATDLLRELDDTPPPEALCGATVGAYRVEAHLRSGGMGHVYRATRHAAGTTRRVALKVLRPGLDADGLLARFARERSTLAGLEHEHVVAFLDAGALPDGRPWLAMEFVEGEPLLEWARGASLRARLRLFLRLLDAVAYAHARLVVHRDLKPSNVLVTAAGAPKLLDFGVAAVLGDGVSPEAGRGPLTPEYASPEELRGEAPTTAGDVYSLGVLLSELVEDAAPDADLRAVAARAAADDPARRYASVEPLAEDVRRWLAYEPVSARPPSAARRLALTARRHRVAVGFVAAVVLSLAAGWVVADLRRRAARAEAGAGWGAHTQARVAAGAFEAWMLRAAAGEDALAADAVAHLQERIAASAAWPETETLLRLALAELLLARGEPDTARPHALRAHELALTTRGVSARDRERAAVLVERVGG